jgi:hypothetical protein
MAVAFLIVALFFVGRRVWLFPIAGAAVGVFAAFRRPEEVVLGSVAAAVAAGTTLIATGLPPGFNLVFVVPTCGLVGVLAAIDDRLAGP